MVDSSAYLAFSLHDSSIPLFLLDPHSKTTDLLRHSLSFLGAGLASCLSVAFLRPVFKSAGADVF